MSRIVSGYETAFHLKMVLERLLDPEEWLRLKDHKTIRPSRAAAKRALKGSLCAVDASLKVSDSIWRESARVVQHRDQRRGINDHRDGLPFSS